MDLEDLLDCYGMMQGGLSRKIKCSFPTIEKLVKGQMYYKDKALCLCDRLEKLVYCIGLEADYPEYNQRHAKKLIEDIRDLYR